MSIRKSNFILLQNKLDEQIGKMVKDLQSKIDVIEIELKEIAEKYPTNSTVTELLGRFLRKNTINDNNMEPRKRCPRGTKARLYAEWNNGAIMEFPTNPMRDRIASLLKQTPPEETSFTVTDDGTKIIVKVAGEERSFKNPYPKNESGLKIVTGI